MASLTQIANQSLLARWMDGRNEDEVIRLFQYRNSGYIIPEIVYKVSK